MKAILHSGAALLLLTLGCRSVLVDSAQDPAADFARYRTFNFKEPNQPADPDVFSPTNQERARAAIVRELEARGYQLSPTPDLMVSIYLRVREKRYDKGAPAPESGKLGYNMQKYYGFYYGYDRSWAAGNQIDYQEGTLIIDLVDTETQRLAWQGTAVGVLYTDRTEAQQAARIREAVQSVFERFPKAQARLQPGLEGASVDKPATMGDGPVRQRRS